jgi:pyrimidine-nucleoside phosphorylase
MRHCFPQYTARRMRAVDIIARKRDGGSLTRDEIRFVVHGVTTETLPDYQAAALLMAALVRGLSSDETAWLTEAMVDSGDRLDLSGVAGSKVDKHSTGGVGDKTSLVIAPLAAACGVNVPMMSGRGLGFTGGTLDKLESIPGFRVELSPDEAHAIVKRIGCAMFGQTASIAPADRKLYALRDVTATVESVPLISASIMSKKLAEGLDALVLDVKAGAGAFMKTEAGARRLAESLVALGKAAGVATEAVITSMDAPLGQAVGNALEVVECLEVLRGGGPADVAHLSLELTARMLVLGRVATDVADGLRRARNAIASGEALERFRRLIEAQEGDPRVVDDPRRLPSAPGQHIVTAAASGYVTRLDAGLIGQASSALGAGRERLGDPVDPAVGIRLRALRGEQVRPGDPVLELHYRSQARLTAALPLAISAIGVEDRPPSELPLVLGLVA